MGISTDGVSPAAARDLKQRIRQALPGDVAASLAVMKALRPLVKSLYPDQKQRSRVLNLLTERVLMVDAKQADGHDRVLQLIQNRYNKGE